MSGHSKWHSIKHQKAAEDKKKGKLFSRLVREITVAARQGGGNAEMNPRLRLAIEKANDANMPKDNILKAIKRGTGELPGVSYIETVYEGYGPSGVAVMVQAATDNKNRTASRVRKIFSENGGSLGESGCVSWIFSKKGFITVPKDKISEDELMEIIIDLDVEDIDSSQDEVYEILTPPEKFSQVLSEMEKRLDIQASELTMIPNSYINLSGKEAEKMIDLMNALEDNEDVQQVYANFDLKKEDIKDIN